MKRGAYSSRGPTYTQFATAIRCVAPDEHSSTVRVHYLSDGSARVAFVFRRQEYFIPAGLIIRALAEVSDREVQAVVSNGVPGPGARDFASERITIVLEEAAALGIRTKAQALSYLGEHFRGQLDANLWETNIEVGERLLSEFIFVHLTADGDKFNLMVLMLQKLYALVTGQCSPDNPDSNMHHEILLPGLLIQTFVREKLQDALNKAKEAVLRECEERPQTAELNDQEWLSRVFTGAITKMDLGRLVEYFLATGNLATKSGLGLSQTSGFTIVADKLNFMRYLSHFRSVHRGAYFAELRTTTVRKLLPESWGFLCPVHTPDGSPCGLLNHLAASCYVDIAQGSGNESRALQIAAVYKALASVGVLVSVGRLGGASPPPVHLTVTLDGAVVGTVRASEVATVVAALRAAKVSDPPRVPSTLEVAYIPPPSGGGGGAFPGLYLFTSPSRMVRPVKQLPGGAIEHISSLEQVFMSIKCPDGGTGGSDAIAFTHEETGPGAMLSAIASCTPWSDYNQSPRNMYQCQMGKQTMGLPMHSFCYRPDTKLYRLQTPQRPIALTGAYDKYHIDEYPLGTNAVVAVLAYTGYDMEDAMIVNKGSMERGLAHATLYKTELVSVPTGSEEMFGRRNADHRGGNRKAAAAAAAAEKLAPDAAIDADGAPRPGSILEPGTALASVIHRATGRAHLHKVKGADRAVVDRVSLMQAPGSRGKKETKMAVTLRYDRNPIIGDKFSSRHGQKGVLSFLWPEEDLPYVERTGVRPDILINPHAFPSRMTIGMLVESMASKAGALDGHFIDASPFQAARDGPDFRPPVEEHGEVLRKHGYNYCGSETMVSGFTGEQFEVDIYIGLVYYQRLRHMVSDKFQVRSLGPNNPLTQQPIKGRKAGGGIRFGEMERDSLLAHGAAYLLHDRLHACSDRHVASICSHCGSLLAPAATLRVAGVGPGGGGGSAAAGGLGGSSHNAGLGKVVCRVCNTGSGIERVALPFVFKYLASELAAMNIRIGLEISDGV
jgi:DNA-directed RNA polymerase I subunit RPA2